MGPHGTSHVCEGIAVAQPARMKPILLALLTVSACATSDSSDDDAWENFGDGAADSAWASSSSSVHVSVDEGCGDPDGWAAVLRGSGFAPNQRVTIRVRHKSDPPGTWVIGNYLDTDSHGRFVDNGFLEGIGEGSFWYYAYDDANGDAKRDTNGAYGRVSIKSPCD